MKYTQAREIVEAAIERLDEMAQTNARYSQMGDHIERATVAYHEGKPGAGRKWRSLVRQDGKEAQSGTLYGRGGRKIKNPRKHKDSRPLGEMKEKLTEGPSLKPHKSNKDPNKGRLTKMAVAMGYPKRKKSGEIFNSDDLNLDKTPSAIFDRRSRRRNK